MPAVSQAQQRFMAMCEHNPKHAAGTCPNMTQAQYHDFAATPRKGLPARAPAKGAMRRSPGRRSKGA